MGTITREKNINGRKIEVTQFTTRKSVLNLLRLSRNGVPVVVKTLTAFLKNKGDKKGGKNDLLDREIDGNDITQAFEMLFSKLDEDEVNWIIDEMFSLTFVNGQPLLPILDLEFQGEVGTMFKVLWFSLEVNYNDFLGAKALKAAFQKITNAVPAVTVKL